MRYFLSLLLASLLSITATATIISPPRLLPGFGLSYADGTPFTNSNLIGKWSLLFFGYSECPAICPQTMAIINASWRALEAKHSLNNLQFIFISLDNDEKAAQLDDFVHKFHPTFKGALGPSIEIEKLGKSLGVYSYQEQQGGKKLIDHTGSLFLITPNGRLKAIFAPPLTAADLTSDLKNILQF